MKKCIFIFLLFVTNVGLAYVFQPGTQYEVCFTPYQKCTAQIVDIIDQAKRNIYVQGYTFTSSPIAKALVRAKERGVSVLVILDKSQFTKEFRTFAGYLMKNNIPVWEDYQVDIAHNKVIIIDNSTVETGSFNYTVAAQHYNAENVLIIHNSSLAKIYLHNWYSRQKVSKLMNATIIAKQLMGKRYSGDEERNKSYKRQRSAS